MKSLIRITAIATVIAAGLAFTSTTFAKAEKTKTLTGKIASIDATAKTVTVKKGKTDEQTFSVTAETKIVTTDKPEATLADLKAGDKVTVSYAETDGKLVAKSICPPSVHKPKDAAK